MNEKVVIEKMNLVMEAAAMNTRLFSFDQLLMGAPVLFINAFAPLFEHEINGLNKNPNNLEAHEQNCSLLLRELRRKVEPDRLLGTSGRKLSSGDRHTISVLADIYYERAEYMRGSSGAREDAPSLSAPPKVIHPRHRMLKKDSSKKKALASDAERDNRGDDPQEVIQNLQQYVAALEHKLESIQVGGGAEGEKKGQRRSGSRERPRGRKASEVDRVRQAGDGDGDGDIEEDDSESVSRAPPRSTRRALSGERQRPSSRGKLRPGSAKTRPKRPSSAPARRPVVASGDREEPNLTVRSSHGGRGAGGLASASHGADVPQKKLRPWSAAPYRPPSVQYLDLPEPAPLPGAADSGPAEKEPFDRAVHTFDTRSGRRILIVDAERNKAQNSRNEAMGNIMGMDDFKDHNKKGAADKDRDEEWHPPEPTNPQWPGARTERSVKEYIVKSKVARAGPDKLPPGSLPSARMLSTYQDLKDSDMLITVEHCCNCHFHNTTLRHDAAQYCAEADTMLKALAASVHASNPCIRLGVYRFNADVTPKSRDSDANSRIGAFEVQVAYRDMFGDLQREMLHSKLASRRWPSKSVTHKRLATFLSKVKVKTHKEPGDGDVYDTEGSCPAGIGHWEELGIGGQAWCYVNYAGTSAPAGRSSKSKNQGNTGTTEAVAESADVSVEWLFDARQFGDAPLFAAGEEVWVSKHGGERHPLPGAVLKADGKNAAMERVVTVRLSYVDAPVTVPEAHCARRDAFAHPLPSYGVGDIPVQLRVLFVHGKSQMHWKVQENDAVHVDGLGDTQHLLCRKSIYQQIKDLALAVEKAKRGRGTFLVPSDDPSEADVDLQLSYAEPVLDWVCEQSPNAEGQVNVDELVTRIAPAPSPQASPKASPREEKEEEKHSLPSSRWASSNSAAPTAAAAVAVAVSLPALQVEVALAPDAAAEEEGEGEGEPRPQAMVAGSVRSFVAELLKWCERDAPQSDAELSPRGKLQRNTTHLKKLFLAREGSGETRSLDVIQFANALERLGLSVSTGVLQGLLATFDDDGDGLLQYDELVSFLHDASANKFSMGDIWTNFRAVLINETEGSKVHRIGELDEEVLSKCKENEELILKKDFMLILKSFGLLEPSIISPADQATLLSRFAAAAGDAAAAGGIDAGKFLAWLHPVDVARASKRLSKSIDWYASRQTKSTTKADVVSRIVATLLHRGDVVTPAPLTAAELAAEVSVKALLEAMYAHQVPVSRAEGRAFSKYFKHASGDVLRVCESAAILAGDLVVRAEPAAEPTAEPGPEDGEGATSKDYDGSPAAKNQIGNDSGGFNFSGEFDSPTQGKGIGAIPVESNNFQLSASFDKEDASKDEVGAPMAVRQGHGLDVCVDLLEISGAPLLNEKLDKVCVVLSCGNSTVKTVFSSSRQKGTATRLLDIKDGQHILHIDVRNNSKPSVKAELYVAEPDPEKEKVCGTVDYPLAADIEAYVNRPKDESGSAQIHLSIPIIDSGVVKLQVNIHFIEAKSSVASRIRKMSSQDLGEFRFQPLSQEYEDDDDFERAEGATHLMPMGLSFGLSSLENDTSEKNDKQEGEEEKEKDD
jgi:hypothetical protein